MTGAILLLPFLLIPHGSGGLLSRKALHATARLNMYHDEDDEDGAQQAQQGQQGQDEEEGAPAADGGGGISNSLTQPLLEPAGMERGAPATAADGAGGGSSRRTLPAGITNAAGAGAAGALPEFSPMQCLRLPDFWLLFLVLTIGMGAGLTLLNNLAQIVKALAGPTDATPVLVSLFSVCNCAGEAALGCCGIVRSICFPCPVVPARVWRCVLEQCVSETSLPLLQAAWPLATFQSACCTRGAPPASSSCPLWPL
jgi:hypothetical protein